MKITSINNSLYNKNQSYKNSRPSFGIKTIEMNAFAEEALTKLGGSFKKDYQDKLSLLKGLKNNGKEIDSLAILGYSGSNEMRIIAKSGELTGTNFLYSHNYMEKEESPVAFLIRHIRDAISDMKPKEDTPPHGISETWQQPETPGGYFPWFAI